MATGHGGLTCPGSHRHDAILRMPMIGTPRAGPAGSASEVLWVALKLGLTSFGGPIAHLGYFERAYVRTRGWLGDSEFAALVGLCQLLPGPSSSQVGFLIGYRRAGWLGALAAWAGFTLPSALLMYVFALVAARAQGPTMRSALHGLMVTAIAVVAQAVWNMARSLCPDWQRTAIALLAGGLLLLHSSATTQFATLAAGAVGGWLLCRRAAIQPELTPPKGPNSVVAWTLVAVFFFILLVLALLAASSPHGLVALGSLFYRSGALVFGGGHVVLPLLRQALVPGGWISDDAFLAGYGFAQAMPGPLFTVAAYLGATSAPPHGSALWSVVALVAIFLPGLLLASAGLSLWSRLTHLPAAPAVLGGINAAVVGVLGAALYNPVFTTGVRSSGDLALAVTALVLLVRWRFPPILVVALCVAAGVVSEWS